MLKTLTEEKGDREICTDPNRQEKMKKEKKITETEHTLLLTNSSMEPSNKRKVLAKEVEQLISKLFRIYV